MQIVIEIPEELKNKIDNANEDNYKTYLWWFETTLYCAIKNGTPLPKGHGRLGDLDALEKEIVNGIKAGNYEEGYETFAHINDMDDCVECVKYADTIIEADGGGTETWNGYHGQVTAPRGTFKRIYADAESEDTDD